MFYKIIISWARAFILMDFIFLEWIVQPLIELIWEWGLIIGASWNTISIWNLRVRKVALEVIPSVSLHLIIVESGIIFQ